MPQTPSQQAKRINKAPGRRMKLATILTVGLLIPIAMAAWNQYGKLQTNTMQLNELKAALDSKTKSNEEIKRELDMMKDPDYRQEKIRKELNVAKDGETVFDTPTAP
ncbi:FtsB family cell division protein [Gorillibacterium massiliense]|uniref:FtsB family cell division protein n=1 Tax=Gorillibacterium massiliense TaxID=1280390 RepID=UPI0004BA6462|nr:septum formation initiator family protein [Gorillibacterium massiliense]